MNAPIIETARPSSSVTPTGKTACVVGAGVGGLALAIRLQSAGIATTVIEGRDKPGYGEVTHLLATGRTSAVADASFDPVFWGLAGYRLVGAR